MYTGCQEEYTTLIMECSPLLTNIELMYRKPTIFSILWSSIMSWSNKDSSLFEHQRFLVHRLMRDTKELSQILHILEEIGGDCRASWIDAAWTSKHAHEVDFPVYSAPPTIWGI